MLARVLSVAQSTATLWAKADLSRRSPWAKAEAFTVEVEAHSGHGVKPQVADIIVSHNKPT